MAKYALLICILFYTKAICQDKTVFTWVEKFDNPSIQWVGLGTAIKIDKTTKQLAITNPAVNNDERIAYRIATTIQPQAWYVETQISGIEWSSNPSFMLLGLSTGIINPGKATITINDKVVDQDVIGVLVQKNKDNDQVELYGFSKDGSKMPVLAQKGILLLPTKKKYYLRLERLHTGAGMLAVFEDEKRSKHVEGSPQCFDINGSITNLQFFQCSNYIFNTTKTEPYTPIKASLDSIYFRNEGFNRKGTDISLRNDYSAGDVIQLQSSGVEDWNLYTATPRGKAKGDPVKKQNGKDFTIDTKAPEIAPNKWYVLKKSISGGQVACGSGKELTHRFYVRGGKIEPQKSKLYKDLKKVANGESIILDQVHFVQSEYYLISKAYQQLDTLIQIMKANPNMEVQLEGHTETIGDAYDNQILSEDRVKEVKSYLMYMGVAAKQVKTVGYGQRNPLRKKGGVNRRVEIRLLHW